MLGINPKGMFLTHFPFFQLFHEKNVKKQILIGIVRNTQTLFAIYNKLSLNILTGFFTKLKDIWEQSDFIFVLFYV